MQPSPYTPGSVAPEVPGRGSQLGEADERLSYMIDLGRLVTRIRVDYAARGVGKTSLLRQMMRHARQRDAVCVWVTAGEHDLPLVDSIHQAIEEQTRDWQSEARGRIRRALEHTKLTVGLPGIAQLEGASGPEEPAPPTARGALAFEHLISETVAAALREDRTGLVLFIDEIQEADPPGLRTLAYAWQHLQSQARELRAAVFAAGLPSAPETLAAAVTFSERLFAYRQLSYLDEQSARVALMAPARELGVEWDDDALDSAITIAQGYPYFLQIVGETTWQSARYPDRGARLTAAHVQAGQPTMREDVHALFRARWEKASPLEKRLMQAMASLGDGPAARADIARALSATSEEISVPRQRLIDKGLIEVAGRGHLTFPIPGFGAYLRDHG